MLFLYGMIFEKKNKINPNLLMKKRTIQSPLSKMAFLALIVLFSMGACKSKKKVVAPEPAPVTEQAPPPPPPAQAQPSAEEVAVGKLENYFNSIANASNVDAANRTIAESLSLFSNKETPVLIVIHEESGIKDYDEPTTIEKYLHYLKDTKKNLNFISDIRLDGSGRVSELELRRKK